MCPEIVILMLKETSDNREITKIRSPQADQKPSIRLKRRQGQDKLLIRILGMLMKMTRFSCWLGSYL